MKPIEIEKHEYENFIEFLEISKSISRIDLEKIKIQSSHNERLLMLPTFYQKIERNNGDAIASLTELCIPFVFYRSKDVLIKLKELGFKKNQFDYFVDVEQILLVLDSIKHNIRKEKYDYEILINYEYLMYLIYLHLIGNLIFSIGNNYSDSSGKTGNKQTSYNYFSEYLYSIKRRKIEPYKKTISNIRNLKDLRLKQKNVDKAIFSFLNIDVNYFYKIISGQTAKIFLAQLFHFQNGIVTIYNPNLIEIPHRDIVLRFLPLFEIICPEWDIKPHGASDLNRVTKSYESMIYDKIMGYLNNYAD